MIVTEEVLLLDDDPAMLGLLEGIFSGARITCHTAPDATVALELIAAHPRIAVVVSDLVMPDTSGLEFVDRLNALELDHPKPRVLLLTAHPSLEAAVDALRLGARDFLVKPIRPAELLEAVLRAIEQSRHDRRAGPPPIPEVEKLMRAADSLAARLRRVALAQSSVLSEQVPMSAADDAITGHAELSDVLQTVEQLRGLRDAYSQHGLDFVAWDLLLELLRAERIAEPLTFAGLTLAINGVSPATSLQRANELCARGYIEHVADVSDSHRDFVSLTAQSRELLADYLARANAHLQDLTRRGVSVRA